MELEKSLLEEYLAKKLPERISSNECFSLLLLVISQKAGALVMSPDFRDRKLLRKFCEDFDLEYREVEKHKRSLIDRLLRRDTRMLKGGFFVARDKDRFEILKKSEGGFYGFSDSSVGKFLGYPEEDSEYFAEKTAEGDVWDETEEIIEELIEEDKLKRSEIKYFELISYVPGPEKTNVLKAVEEGKQREKAVLEFDEKFDTEIGERYIAEMVRQSNYSSECSNASRP